MPVLYTSILVFGLTINTNALIPENPATIFSQVQQEAKKKDSRKRKRVVSMNDINLYNLKNILG